MDALRVSNLRSLGDTDFLDLKPITILLGKNSSGKSTFLRSLPLLRQSTETQTEGPILWYGDYTDFGGFDEAFRHNAESQTIDFGFRFELSAATRAASLGQYRSGYGPMFIQLLHDCSVECSVNIARSKQDKSISRVSGIKLQFAGHTLSLSVTPNEGVVEFQINQTDLLATGRRFEIQESGNFLPIVGRVNKPDIPAEAQTQYRRRQQLAPKLLFAALKPHFHGNTEDRTIWNISHQLRIGNDEAMLENLRALSGPKTWKDNVAKMSTADSGFCQIRDSVIANKCDSLLKVVDVAINSFTRGVRYIAPVRAQAKRFYRPQSLSVQEVNPRGDNLAVFLRSLDPDERESFRRWTERHFSIVVRATAEGEHLSITLNEVGEGPEYNLADVGFGFSQVIPVLAQLWAIQTGSRVGHRPWTPTITCAIEQPELHLHPSLQAKLADVFLEATSVARDNNIDLRVLIESHSETIVNRIGERIAESDDLDDLSQVIVFERETPTYTVVRTSEYNEEGFLQNWPYGFFDPDESN